MGGEEHSYRGVKGGELGGVFSAMISLPPSLSPNEDGKKQKLTRLSARKMAERVLPYRESVWQRVSVGGFCWGVTEGV